MPNLIEYLESFNRKERFFLMKQALGDEKFQLSNDFRASLTDKFGISVPADAFFATDYHLDWLHLSLFLIFEGNDEVSVHPNTADITTGNIRDIDLLVAFNYGALIHLLLLEAKGEMGWDNEQILRKASRLREIFGEDGTSYDQVKPHFCLVSERPPQRLESDLWPSWMTPGGGPHWLKLEIPKGRLKATRCDAGGKKNKDGQFFRVLY